MREGLQLEVNPCMPSNSFQFTATIDDLKKKIEASTEEYRKSVDKANSTQAALLEKELPSLLKVR